MRLIPWDHAVNKVIIEPIDPNGRIIESAVFSNCEFTGLTSFYPQLLFYSHSSKQLILPTIEQFMSLGRGTIYEETMEYDFISCNPAFLFEEPVFYFVYNMANYYHFVYDTLPYLFTYFKQKKKYPNLKLLVNVPDKDTEGLYSFVIESLQLLGIPEADLVFLDTNVLYKKVILGSSLTHNRMSNSPPSQKVFALLEKMASDSDYVGPQQVYISRRSWVNKDNQNIGTDYTQRRRCTNEDDVVKIFEDFGFVEIFCENMSMQEKIGLFKNAKMIAGPIGGGMCNVIFSEPQTKVFSINSPLFFEVNNRFKFSMNHTQLYHFNETQFCEAFYTNPTIVSQNDLSISGGLNSPWSVDLKKLKNSLEGFMGE